MTECKRSLAYAQDEAKWLKLKDSHEVPEQLLEAISRCFTSEQRWHICSGASFGQESPFASLLHPLPQHYVAYGPFRLMDQFVTWAKQLVSSLFPHVKCPRPLSWGPRGDLAMAGPLALFDLKEGIKEALFVRLPRFKKGQQNDIFSAALRA